MSIPDRSLYFETDYSFELIGTSIKKFLVFSIKKTYPTLYPNHTDNLYETFLLVKSQPNSAPEKFLVFARQKIPQSHSELQSTENHFLKSETYYSSFLRHVDLTYCRRLSQLLNLLGVYSDTPLENQWLMLYEVHNYIPSISKISKYELKTPTYGSPVLLTDHHQPNSQCSLISNLFRINSQNIYFINDQQNHQIQSNDLQLVLSSNEQQIHGLTFKVKDELICLPLCLILYDKPCETLIDAKIKRQLEKTCYISYMGSYCTGIEVNERQVITARHLLPANQYKFGTNVIVKKYPYKQNIIGVVSRIGNGSLDIIQIDLLHLQHENRSPKSSHIVKQELTGNLQKHHQKNTNRMINDMEIQQSIESQGQIFNKKCFIGDEIVALGFGRFSFNVNIFNAIDMALPTAASGIVSKVIELNNEQMFLKTDAKLYSGFSGCGIWNGNLLGMAVFILKNKTSNSHLNRENFSYTSRFIHRLLKQKDKHLRVSFTTEIQQFDKIQTRNHLHLIDSPKPKL